MFRYIVLVSIVAVLASCGDSITKKKENPVDYVNPFIGTGGHGHTYPGASLPFGMVQLSPDTRLDGWDGCSGYHYSDSIIYGFTHTHLSGTGCLDYGDILLMPVNGEFQMNNGKYGYPSGFSHENENASPGYYQVLLDKYNINVELTCTKRCGLHQYTFPKSDLSGIVVDLKHRDFVIESYIKKVSDSEIEGFRRSKSWANDQYVYFVAKFSKPFDNMTIYSDDSVCINTDSAYSKNIKAFFGFKTDKNEKILVKVGISAVSTQGARKNLDSEITEWDFENIKNKAQEEWNEELKKIEVSGGTEEQLTCFYTALYHSLLNPNLFMDVDGKYRGTDLQIHQAKGFTNYTVFSLWDTFRATHPLFTIIERDRTKDFLKTFIWQYKNGGKLPVWELAGNYTGCMIGYHSIPVIVDAYISGINDFDTGLMMEAMLNSSEKEDPGLKAYMENGYIPSDAESESVSKTLEYAYDDWCIATYAKKTGNDDIYNVYIQRAQNYKNVFDPVTKFMRAKTNESWINPFDPKEVNFNYTEANAWQYCFFVPQDINTLIDLYGGKEFFAEKLDELFSETSQTTGREQADITGMIGQYAHGNEPSHHIAYLYSFAGQPWKTQKYVRQILDSQYFATPDGLSGNEDCGQMSSWYVLSSLGFYPVTPGSGLYIIGTPLFPEAKINLENGKHFIIKANNLSKKNIYIQSAKLNGKEYNFAYLKYNDIINGGELVFEMGPEPNYKWGVDNLPVSRINDNPITIVPFVQSGSRTFRKSQTIELATPQKDAIIYYTLDGSEPDENSSVYIHPFEIDTDVTLKAVAVLNGIKSKVITAEFSKMHENWDIELKTKYANQYSAGGNYALIDCLTGSLDFRTGRWQGYQGVDLEAIVDMGKISEIKEIAVRFLQDQNSWIFMPEKVEFYVSKDGGNFIKIGEVINDIPQLEEGAIIKEFKVKHNDNARYVKIIAKNPGKCPENHPGAGNPAWIFADEIIINQ
ncbi:MAG: GH92 family glycosyl hydrolase [Marinilabiliales bacterium]